MSRKIVITGATGLIGSRITRKLVMGGDKVIVFTRDPKKAKKKLPSSIDFVKWNYDFIDEEWKKELDGADAVIHLAGENVMSGRWTEEHKNKVYHSRVEGTNKLVDAIAEIENKPDTFISASAIGYYDNDIEKEFDEETDPGNSFLSTVTKDWEAAAARVEQYDVRRVSIRIGIVLDMHEGALAQMLTPFNYFIGGPIGSGKQWMPWIHIDDVANIFIHAIKNSAMHGPYNAVSGNVKMAEFANTLGSVISRPSFFKVPSFVIKLILGDAASLVLKGSKIIPTRTLESGYKFNFENLEEALKDILK